MEYIPLYLFIIGVIVALYLWYSIGEQVFDEAQERRRLARHVDKNILTIGNEINLLRMRLKAINNKQSRRLDIHLHEETTAPKGKGKEAMIPPRKVQ